MMPRALFTSFVIVTSGLLGFASPVSMNETVQLEKRITHVGRGTWFHTGLGACGKRNVDTDLIVAIPAGLYDQNQGSNCDQYVKITANGKTAYGLTRDRCASCGSQDLDLSPALFKKFAPSSVGIITVTWNFEPKGFKP